MSKRIRKSTQIRQARKEAVNRKRAAFEFQRPMNAKVLTGKTSDAGNPNPGIAEFPQSPSKHTRQLTDRINPDGAAQ
jgi:hypothetical protein